MRRIANSLAALVLGVGALSAATGTAFAAQPPVASVVQSPTASEAQPVPVADVLCNAGGGFVVPSGGSPTGFICVGGVFDGHPVIITD